MMEMVMDIYDPIDLNGNNRWDPNEDKPDLLGYEYSQTAWCVYNDGVDQTEFIFQTLHLSE